ncbi:interleukin-12 receptor subunit beta-2 isoform X2 [Antennarius striatus]|uniref:interleukin-12 receptor subunit beta-2 isoform X2 n=1 Tax=Antennarius striatus TaxID=241820 RepID=UPI0035AEF647
MEAVVQTWAIIAAAVMLAVQLCAGEASCSIWSSAGPVVHRGSSFEVFCTFRCKCKGSMNSGHPPTPQSHKELNSTTIYKHIVNITKNPTYSCECDCSAFSDPCGLDISSGYPPDIPHNVSCFYNVRNNEGGDVVCFWNRVRHTYLRDSSVLWVRPVYRNHTVGPVTYNVSSKTTNVSSASLRVSSLVKLISVWVQVQNQLGSEVSITVNHALSDIAVPMSPALDRPECSSRECIIRVNQSVMTQHLQIQYKAEAQTWTAYPVSGVQMSLVQAQSIVSLEPSRLYHFRARTGFSTNLWSQWSSVVSSWTQEEAPARELDVWYTEPVSDFKSLRVYWKVANISIARGKIIDYKIRVYSQSSGLVFSVNISANARSYSVPFCTNCEVTVWACNSKGLSPPARITTQHTKAKPLKDIKVKAGNHSVTISWRNPETVPKHAAYVVEWYPQGLQLEELRWVRLNRNVNCAVLTGVKHFECYEGAVCAVYDDSSVSRTRFKGVAIVESAPTAGPSVQEQVEGNKVKVTWMEINREQRGGCITSYTIYIENNSGDQWAYPIPTADRAYTLTDLSPAGYTLWMTASTAKGEGPAGQKVKFFIHEETKLPFIVTAVVSVIALFFLCLFWTSPAKQRLWVFFRYLIPDDVPDPANSKWAKDCTQEKGKNKLSLQPHDCSVTEEEEPILVDVEELPKQNKEACTPISFSQQLLPQTSLIQITEPDTPLYPPTTYIKSFSQDSESSNHTQTSLDTNIPVDYLASHIQETMNEEQEDEDEDFPEMESFFPSYNTSIEPLDFGGKLTLDAVKISSSDFFQNNNF